MQSIEINPEQMELLDLPENEFKLSVLNVFKEMTLSKKLKENMSIISPNGNCQ